MKFSSYRLGSQFVARSRFGLLKLSVTESVWILYCGKPSEDGGVKQDASATALPQLFGVLAIPKSRPGPGPGELWTKTSASEFKNVLLFYPIRFKWLSFLCDSGLCL